MVGYRVHVLRILLFIGAACTLLPSATVLASGSWNTGRFTWGDTTTIHNMPLGDGYCHPESETIVGVTSLRESGQVCVYDRPNFRYGIYKKEVPVWYGATFIQKYFVISLGSDSNMYVVENMSADRMPIYVAGSNDLHLTTYISYGNNQVISYIKDFPTKLQRITEFGQTLRYKVFDNAEEPFIPNVLSDPVVIGGASASNNGKWMAIEIKNAGFVRIDTETRSLYGFSKYVHPYNMGMDASIVFKISDDGTKIAAFDSNISPIVYSLDSTCELLADTYNENFINSLRTNECPSDNGRLYEALSQVYNSYQLRNAEAYGFNNDADTLYFDDVVDANERFMTIERKPLYAGEFTQEQSIEYLALGDSFTSGEGDIELNPDGSSYYLPGTEANNKCHVSSRSYPFLLREQMNIANDRMQTVACSGARVIPDYIGNPTTYKGQGNRVSNLSSKNLATKQAQALQNFMPGLVTQLEFVKKYQPKTTTLMGGGNDVGFGDILQYCASPTWQGVFVNDTCGYAIEGSPLRKMLGSAIQSQYTYTLKLLRMIREVSPLTSVYVIGYPSFISEDESAVCLNSAALNADERIMINEGITAMNTMLEAASDSMGVKYVDVQDTLEGGRLCEGSEYVTGVTDVINQTLDQDTHEMFHPNASAHAKMASRILSKNFQVSAGQNQTPLEDSQTLDVQSRFGATAPHVSLQWEIMDTTVVEQSNPAISIAENSLAPGSTATLTMYSQPTQLGEILVNANGGINENIVLPASIGPGLHVLLLEGKSSSGEPVSYYQFVTIVSKQVDDADADGISNRNDKCLFITSWIDEASDQDVCTVKVVGGTSNNVSSKINESGSNKNGRLAVVSDEPAELVVSGEKVIKDIKIGEVLGVHKAESLTGAKEDNLYVAFGLIGLSTLVGAYGILRVIKGIDL